MSPLMGAAEALEHLAPAPSLVVLMCGLAGSGKTTFSRQLEAKGFVRLSIDEIVWDMAGRFGVDFDAADYPRHLEAARGVMRRRLIEAMRAGTPIVVDSAFWNRAARDEYKALIEEHDREWRLIYLKAAADLLHSRLRERAARFDANAQFEVTPAMLEVFLASFEAPQGEGEIVVRA